MSIQPLGVYPLLIEYTDSKVNGGYLQVVYSPEDIRSGKGFRVLQTNYSDGHCWISSEQLVCWIVRKLGD